MNLIIVESPTKAKTISKFLGKDFHIESTMGHVRDLPVKKLGVEIREKRQEIGDKKTFEFLPEYKILEKKEDVVKKLKEEAKKADKIYLATDPDREGEAIAWHVAALLGESQKSPPQADQPMAGKVKSQKAQQISRISFHEITKTAIEKALSKDRAINLQLVDAQQARRILDRLVGYKLSPLLWKKIRRGLSAGRVQSVVVRLIVDREREIEKFVPVEYWEVWGEFKKHLGGELAEAKSFLAKLAKKNGELLSVSNGGQSAEAVSELEKAAYEIGSVEKKETTQNPPPPFITSTLQQKAARVLGFSSKRTMQVAQRLYENGLITYHRTDSVNLAVEAITAIRNFIGSEYGKNYLPESPRIYKTKSKVAQEAHEAIRPTDINCKVAEMQSDKYGNDEERLYELIWKRTAACQTVSVIYDQTKIDVRATGEKNIYDFEADGRIMKFDGWRKIYLDSGDKREIRSGEDGEMELPEVKAGDDIDLVKIDPQQKFTQPPARFNEASLIKTLEQMGIGRPSTYAPTISTIQDRQYVEKEDNVFHPTPLGITVNDFITDYFPEIVDYQFTAKMEDGLDDIANGKAEWMDIISDFWGPFENKLGGVTQTAEKVSVPTEAIGESCPECKEGQLVIRIGRFGKFISCSRFPDCKYTAPYLQKVDGFKCPKCGSDVIIKKTRKGKKFFSCSTWPKCDWSSWRKPGEEGKGEPCTSSS